MSEFLADNSIRYEVIDVEQVGNGDQLINVLGISGYPVTYIGYHRVMGMDYKAIERLTGT